MERQKQWHKLRIPTTWTAESGVQGHPGQPRKTLPMEKREEKEGGWKKLNRIQRRASSFGDWPECTERGKGFPVVSCALGRSNSGQLPFAHLPLFSLGYLWSFQGQHENPDISTQKGVESLPSLLFSALRCFPPTEVLIPSIWPHYMKASRDWGSWGNMGTRGCWPLTLLSRDNNSHTGGCHFWFNFCRGLGIRPRKEVFGENGSKVPQICLILNCGDTILWNTS